MSKKETKQEPEGKREQNNSKSERPQRERKAPNYFREPVVICGVEKPETIQFSPSAEN